MRVLPRADCWKRASNNVWRGEAKYWTQSIQSENDSKDAKVEKYLAGKLFEVVVLFFFPLDLPPSYHYPVGSRGSAERGNKPDGKLMIFCPPRVAVSESDTDLAPTQLFKQCCLNSGGMVQCSQGLLSLVVRDIHIPTYHILLLLKV